MRARILRRRGSATGLALVVLGAWGAIIPFVGPYFNYSMGRNDAWMWQDNRLWLEILPGAAAVLGGLLLIRAVTRATAMLGGLLGLASGIWFVVGPLTSTLWEHGSVGVGPALGGTFTRWVVWMGFFYALGAAITALSGMVLGRMSALTPDVVEAPLVSRGAARERVGPPPVREPAGTERREPVATEGEPTATPATTDAPAGKAAPPRSGGFLRRRRGPEDRTPTT